MKYAKNTKNMTITKRLLCLLLCFVMGVMCVLFSGCSLEDNLENEKLDKSFFENYVGGFNTVYASSQYGTPRKIEDNLSIMLGYMRDGLLYNYGNVKVDLKDNKYGNVFPDSIRMIAFENNNELQFDTSKHWKWMINPYNVDGVANPYGCSNLVNWQEYILNNGIIDSDYDFHQSLKDAFQLILYEIMLGYSPTKIKVEYEDFGAEKPYSYENEDGKHTLNYCVGIYSVTIESSETIKNNGQKIANKVIYKNPIIISDGVYDLSHIEIKYNKTNNIIKNRLYGKDREVDNPKEGSLAWEYKNSTLYNGLTKQNADKLIDYILKEIIGETVVNYDYSTFRNAPVNYRNYVSTIAYLIYSQTYDGSGDLWEYEYSSGSVKLSYKFTPAQRVKAMRAGLLNEDGVDVDTAWSGSETNPTIITEVQAGFSAKPATFVRYYEGETFFGDDVEDQFAGRPYVEYQSVVIDPAYTLENAKTRGLELEAGFCFNFMTKNKNLKIAMKVRYFIYDSATGTGQLYEFQCDTVNFTDGATVYKNANGETCYENDFEASIDTAELEKYNPSLVRHESTENDPDVTHFTVPFFGSSEIIRSASKGEVSLSEAKNIANLYKVIESEKGYGGLTVLDEKRVKTSFYEVVLDVIKSPEDTNTDYRFSMVLSNTVLSPGIW